MAKKSKKNNNTDKWHSGIKEETKHSILAIISFVLALFLTLSAMGKAGMVGESVFKFFEFLFGGGFFLLPISFFLTGVSFLTSFRPNFMLATLISSVFFFISSLGITDIILKDGESGGFVGKIISFPLIKLFDFWVSLIILFAILIISLLVMFNMRLKLSWPNFLKWPIFNKKNDYEKSQIETDEDEYEAEDEEPEEGKNLEIQPLSPVGSSTSKLEEKLKGAVIAVKDKMTSKKGALDEGSELIIESGSRSGIVFSPPPISLLENDKGKPAVGDTKANSNIIKRTLQNFGIETEMGEISIGPSVTQYTLKPAEGVKLSKIVALQNDLSLSLAAYPIRIEAPIPGKSLVGIEIPNTIKAIVGLASLLKDDEYQNSPYPLLFALGRGVSGKAFFSNLAKMPHILIAGATGAGKSVMIHALITSLLYRNSPENLKLIMVDPKRVELTLYNNIPHLLTPVVTDAKKAILALRWAAREMDRRYDILEKYSTRDIQSYHKNILAPYVKENQKRVSESDENEENASDKPETLPYIVVIVDELADIMTSYPRELESAIVRLAQMSRAVGIHLVISTQRPSVEVITGLIKANIPSRIALQVASQIDSRTILDMSGAEKLLGSGDMLYLASDMAKPRRIQSPFISENEVKKVVKFLKDRYEDYPPADGPQSLNLFGAESEQNSIFNQKFDDETNTGDDDELYEEAREIVIEAGKASSSYLQRKLKVGYARAARLLDILEERGVVGPADGSKPREIYEEPKNDD
ncbi:MAG: DNA translocase FtsK [Parcubacteria group bacterium]|nr:DNA translocase FtsK [Parcubacteria group bacterium]MCR4342493.1 DNA translocase FtsK [Patescibacteria group bacterium]